MFVFIRNRVYLAFIFFVVAVVGAMNRGSAQVAYSVDGHSRISAFRVNADGSSAPIPGSPFSAGKSPSSIALHPSGKFVYIANSGSNDVSAYRAGSAGELSPVADSPFRAGANPSALALDRAGRFLYVINAGSSDISAYRIDQETGALAAVPGSPFVTGAVPAGAAVHPNGQFLFVANSGSGTISSYAIHPLSGALSRTAGSPIPAGGNARSIAVHPSGKFAYVAKYDADGASVSAFAINADTGELTAAAASAITFRNGPVSFALNPDGRFAYVANAGSLATYTIDSNTGSLTLVPGSRFSSRLGSKIVMDPAGRFVFEGNAAHRVSPGTGILTPSARALSGPQQQEPDPEAVAVGKPALAGTPLISVVNLGSPRNNFTGGFGMKFTVGATPINVSSLGRFMIAGNTGTHVVKLVNASDGTDVPGGSVAIDLASGTPGDFVYAPLASPVTLAANTSYYLISQETNGGDQFYDLSSVLPTSAAAVNGGFVYSDLTGFIGFGPANNSYVPVNLLYTAAGAPPSVAITAPANGTAVSGNTVPVTATATAGAGQTVASIQFKVDNVNAGAPVTSSPYATTLDTTGLTNGSHSLTAVALDSSNNSGISAPITITVNNNPTVAVTAPSAGSTVTGSTVTLSATAAAVPGLTIANVQFKLDGQNFGSPVTTAPYSLVLDSTGLTNATHSLLAVATDSGGHMTTSAPVSFTVNNTTTSISIATPTAGSTVAGSVPATATVAPGPGVTISKVQFQLDNVNLGAAITSAPFTIMLDTAGLTNGSHTLQAIATDSNNKTVSSSPVTFNVSNSAPPPAGTPLLGAVIPGTARNNATGLFGLKFTVGAAVLNVSALGRVYIQGNTGSHVVKLVRASDGMDVPGASVTINLPAGPAGQYVYAPLASPVTLDPGASYYLVSQETNGGDQFYDLGPVTPTADVTVNNGVVNSLGLGYVNIGPPNKSYVPVNLIYTSAGTPPTVSVTAPAEGSTISGNHVTLSANAGAGTGLGVASVQFKVDNVNQGAPVTTGPFTVVLDATKLSNGPHVITAVVTDTNSKVTTSAPVNVTVNNNPTVSVTAPVAGTTVSGKNVTLSASAVPASGLSIASVQFKVDNVNQGVPVTTSPYSIVLDTTGLSNASHSVVAIATDSANGVTTSAPVVFNVDNTVTTVAITSPVQGATTSGTVPLTAAATAGPGLTITKVQFLVDNANVGAAVVTNPYTIALDTTKLTDGPHTLLASATDSSNKTVVSSPVTINVSNGGVVPATGMPLITAFSSGGLRNNAQGGFGLKFTVGSMPLNVIALGRIYVQGNNQSHLLKLARASDGSDVPGGSVTLTLPSGTPGQFAYAQLASPVTLAANTSYYLVSLETYFGDQFYDIGPVTATNKVTVDSGASYSPGINFYSPVGLANTSYGPVSLLYTNAAAPPTVTIGAPAGGSTISGNNVTVTATATAAPGLTISKVQFQVDNVNQGAAVTSGPYSIVLDATKLTNGQHTITAIATDSTNISTISANVNVVVNNDPTVTVTSPAAGTTVSGKNVTLSAAAVPVNGLTISQVQFKIDNVAQGPPVTTSPYNLVLDTTVLSNASHSVVAVATDSGNHTVTSAPVSFTVDNNVTTVNITAPAQQATVSGTVQVSAAATAGPGLTIFKVQFQVDNVNQGAAITSAPYGIMLDTTGLTNGPHSLVAIATDSSNKAATSQTVTINVSNGPPPISGTPIITGITTPGKPRNNSTGAFGMKFTVGAQPLTVTALGRIYIAGNTQSHVVKLVRASDGMDVPGGAVTINLPSGNPGEFVYGLLPAPVTLDANTMYYLVSTETNGGDLFYDLSTVTATNEIAVNNGVVFQPSLGYVLVGPANSSFVPVSMIH